MVRSPRALRSATARSERPIRRWISWVRPALLAARRFARGARVRRARQHAVLGGDPSLPLAAQERRYASPRRSRCTAPGCRRKRSAPSLPRAWRERRSKLTARSCCGWRPEGRATLGHSASQRTAAAEVLSLPAPARLMARSPRRLRAWGAAARGSKLGHDFLVLEGTPQPVGADHDDVARLERAAAAQRHVRQDRIPAQAALDEVAHRMIVRLLGA